MTFKKIVVPQEMAGKRLDLVIAKLDEYSRKEAKDLIENGYVLVNGIKITFASTKLNTADKITIAQLEFNKNKKDLLKIIYEDSSLLVVDKPANILTNKVAAEKGVSVQEILANKGLRLYPVHRLDRETTGVLVFAKTRQAEKFLLEEFKRRRVNKKYLGLVDGAFKQKRGIIKGRLIGTDEYAKTGFRVIRRFKNATLLEFYPKTGKTHQIRLQLARLGNPLVGEKRYISGKSGIPIFFPRHALHAVEIKFTHPLTKKPVQFFSPIPEDLNKLIKFLSCG